MTILHRFAYHRPREIAEAVALLGSRPAARLLAGGQSLIPALKHGAATPSDLIDLSAMSDLAGIAAVDGMVEIGAMTRQEDVLTSPVVRSQLPVLPALLAVSGDVQVRSLGTFGGAVAWNDPEGDFAAAVLALGATIETDRRRIAADAFFTGPFQTALSPDEILLRLVFPPVLRAGYAKLRHPARGSAMAGVCLAQPAQGAVRVAVTGAGRCAFRWSALEAALTAEFRSEIVDTVALSVECVAGGPADGSDYRLHLVGVMAKRAVAAALGHPPTVPSSSSRSAA